MIPNGLSIATLILLKLFQHSSCSYRHTFKSQHVTSWLSTRMSCHFAQSESQSLQVACRAICNPLKFVWPARPYVLLKIVALLISLLSTFIISPFLSVSNSGHQHTKDISAWRSFGDLSFTMGHSFFFF